MLKDCVFYPAFRHPFMDCPAKGKADPAKNEQGTERPEQRGQFPSFHSSAHRHLPASLTVLVFLAFAALTITGWGEVSIFFSVFVPVLAMCLTCMVRSHCKPFPKNATFWIKNFGNGVALLCSGNDGIRFESNHFSKHRGRIFDAVNHNGSRNARVPHLVALRRPTAIIQFVVSICVYAIKRKAFWPLTHVLHKCRKTFLPAFTNRNASPTVVRKSLVFWIEATLLHLQPSSVKRMSAQVMALTHLWIMRHDIKNIKEAPSVV